MPTFVKSASAGGVAAILCILPLLRLLADEDRADTPEAAVPALASEAETPEESTGGLLPAPHTIAIPQYEKRLFEFLKERRYIELGWKRDKGVRDTGPFIEGKYYGTHPAVRVFYSPEIIAWLEGGRRGTIPDGAMIVKEQFAPPAARHAEKNEEELRQSLESWTVMIKDAAGSHDGWFWSNPGKDQEIVDNHADFSYPLSGFGLYCIRCHASTRSPDAEPGSPENEFTFAALRNIEGYEGEPILFLVDDSWRQEPASESGSDGGETAAGSPSDGGHPNCALSGGVTLCTAEADADFVNFYGAIARIQRDEVNVLPPVTHDWVSKERDPSQQFVTSNQCMSCHAGLLKPFGPTMFVPAGENQEYGAEGFDISPFGEWRWTPMGLAGRDPFFLAQLECETMLLQQEFGESPARSAQLVAALEDTCLRCHAAMGRHQFHCDSNSSTGGFPLDLCEKVAGQQEHIGRGDSRYGALAREGVSCMVCHRMQPPEQPADDSRPYLQYFLETSTTGNLHFGPPDEIYGPFKDDEITAYPMQHAMGLTPKYSEFLRSSRMCGTCHTVSLPAVDQPVTEAEFDELNRAQVVEEFASFHHHVEQATYLEWLNSEFENEFTPDNPLAQSCQDCHMDRSLVDEEHGIDLANLATRMAVIQDATYPDAENLAPHEQLEVRVRQEGYRRHNFSGLNLLLLELFDQFPDVLGVRKQNFMTGSGSDLENARRTFLQNATERTAELHLEVQRTAPGQLQAEVTVLNKAGHRFPTGVGFRRAFIELLVTQNEGELVWSSGRTNSLGVLVDETGRPLPTEFFESPPGKPQSHQPHYEEITAPDQVQIYESLLCNAQGRFTTSFLHACKTQKDNRLLPRGWRSEGPDPALSGRYLEATHPGPLAAKDPEYIDGSGSDRITYRIALPPTVDHQELQVQATLYYQSAPPYFLRNLFRTAPEGKATQRLYYLLSHLDLSGTPLDGWKLQIARAARIVSAGDGSAVTP